MTDTGEIIRKLRTGRGWTQEQLGSKLGVQKSAIAKYENGHVENLKRSTIQKMSTIFHVSPIVFLGIGEERGWSSWPDINSNSIHIPLYQPICYEDDVFCDDNIIEYISIPSKGLSNPSNYFAQIAKGNSMIDAGINDGDLLVFDKRCQVYDGMIGAFCIGENEACCKKYKEKDGFVILNPMNRDFDPIIVAPDEEIRCVGQLVRSIKNFQK